MEDNLRKVLAVGHVQRQGFKRAAATGVKMVCGADCGVYPHGGDVKQLAAMVRAGSTPLPAIEPATSA